MVGNIEGALIGFCTVVEGEAVDHRGEVNQQVGTE